MRRLEQDHPASYLHVSLPLRHLSDLWLDDDNRLPLPEVMLSSLVAADPFLDSDDGVSHDVGSLLF